MIDNIIIDSHGCIGQCCLSYCRTLSTLSFKQQGAGYFVFNDKGLDFFVFNDNIDND